MPRVAAPAAVTDRQRYLANQHAFSGDVVANAATRAVVISAQRLRSSQKGVCV
jgi:hypothetical protein